MMPNREVKRRFGKMQKAQDQGQKPQQDDVQVPLSIRSIIFKNCRGKSALQVLEIIKTLLRMNRDAYKANQSLMTAINWLIIMNGNDYY